jgi:hypothetical protein
MYSPMRHLGFSAGFALDPETANAMHIARRIEFEATLQRIADVREGRAECPECSITEVGHLCPAKE